MKNTKIQWCHSTVNLVMGCDGCELWPGGGPLGRAVIATLGAQTESPPSTCRNRMREAIGDQSLSVLYANRKDVAQDVTGQSVAKEHTAVVGVFRHRAKCYAGLLGTMRGGHAGYADQFEIAKPFPGRMAKAAAWGRPTEDEIDTKPWLEGLPRLIFISDMGDALSHSIPFEYLQAEIVDHVGSVDGRRHVWLWLTKRPSRMAQFGRWLNKRNVTWPDNLVAMTTVTAQARASRVADLLTVPSKLKGLSIKTLFETVDFGAGGARTQRVLLS